MRISREMAELIREYFGAIVEMEPDANKEDDLRTDEEDSIPKNLQLP